MWTAVKRCQPSSARRIAAWMASALLIATLAVPVALAAPAAGAAPAARTAASFSQYDLVVATTTRSSSTHKSLQVLFSVADNTYGSGDTVTIDLVGNGEIETHAWQFQVPANSIDAGASSLTLNSGSALGAFGTIKLTVTSSGAGKNTCLGGFKVEQHPVSVKETYSFDTHSTGSKAWGTVTSGSGSVTVSKGSSIGSFSFTPCTASPNDCTTGTSWNLVQLDSNGGYVFIGNTGAIGLEHATDIDLGRVVDLASPADAIRTDVILAKEPAAALTKHGKSASLKVTTSGSSITGSAVLNSVKASSTTSTRCSASKTQKEVDWPSSFVNGSKPLTAVEQIFGNFSAHNVTKISDSNNAEIEVWTD